MLVQVYLAEFAYKKRLLFLNLDNMAHAQNVVLNGWKPIFRITIRENECTWDWDFSTPKEKRIAIKQVRRYTKLCFAQRKILTGIPTWSHEIVKENSKQ